MRLTRPRTKRPPETIVALIDVVFFLLVFALLIGRMDATSPFAVLPPIAATGTDLPAGGTIISISSDGELAVSGVVVDRARLIESVARSISDKPETRLRVNADGTTSLRHVLPLVEDLRQIGASEVVLVVTPEH